MFDFMSGVVTVWRMWECLLCIGRCLSIGVVKYVVCLCRECDGYCVFCLNCEVWSCRCSYVGCMSV